MFAEEEARLLTEQARDEAGLAALVARRAAGEPLEHVLGWAEFCGLRIAVEPGVFVPRRRTEFLVKQAAGLARGPVVVDLCCGSGAVGAALAARLGHAEVHASDLDPAAVACARRNLAAAGGRVYQGDLYQPLPARLRGRVDILAANVPYVPSGELETMPREARSHEPRSSLDGGRDGLAVLRRAAAGAPPWLAPQGLVLMEIGARQAAGAAEALARAGLAARVVACEDMGATVVIGSRPLPERGAPPHERAGPGRERGGG